MSIFFLLLFFLTITYPPVSRVSGTGGASRGGDWVQQNTILWDNDEDILWDSDEIISFDGGS